MSDQEKRRQAVDTIARQMIVRTWWDGEHPQDPPDLDEETMWEVSDRAAEITKSIDVTIEQYDAAVAHLREDQLAPAEGGG